MKRINIAFVCTDTDYAGAVAKALMCEDPGIQVMVAQNIPENKGEYDLIIISGMEEDPKNDDCIYLNGFVSLPEILWLIREKRPNHGPSEPFRSTSDNISQIVMVTGASGGCGVTSVSEALAEELTVYYDKKVCVLSFSLFPENTTGESINSIKKLIYFIKRKNGEKYFTTEEIYCNTTVDLNEYFSEDDRGVWHPSYGKSVNCLATEKGTDKELLEYLATKGNFDYIICDVPSQQLWHNSEITNLSNEIVFIRKPEDNKKTEALLKIEKYFNEILLDETEKIINVLNLWDSEAEDELKSDKSVDKTESFDSRIYAEYDKDSFINGKIRIDGSFGIAIKNIAHRLYF